MMSGHAILITDLDCKTPKYSNDFWKNRNEHKEGPRHENIPIHSFQNWDNSNTIKST